MKSLIKDRCILCTMSTTNALEDEIRELFDNAVACMRQKGRAINLLRGNPLYTVDVRGINKYWNESDHRILTEEEFFSWLCEQPIAVQKQVHANLLSYIKTPTPKEQGKVEFPQPKYLFGY